MNFGRQAYSDSKGSDIAVEGPVMLSKFPTGFLPAVVNQAFHR